MKKAWKTHKSSDEFYNGKIRFFFFDRHATLIRIISPCIQLLHRADANMRSCAYEAHYRFANRLRKLWWLKKRESNSHACVIRLRTVTSIAVKKMRCERSSVLQFESHHCESLKFRLFRCKFAVFAGRVIAIICSLCNGRCMKGFSGVVGNSDFFMLEKVKFLKWGLKVV